jgi:cytochrome oxidase Cu insertion factor (SCO1/SenC/PrrC family)
MHLRPAIIIFVGALIGVTGALAVFPDVRNKLLPAPSTIVTGKALVGGPFTLIDDKGKTVTEKDYSGRYTLVFFGFTSCPDICPAGLQLISAALENLGPKADRITPIFVSIDPERDTPAKIGAYVKNFNSRIVGLTGTPPQVDAIAKAYKVYYKKVANEGGPPGDYTMDHTSIIYLMNPEGEFVTHFTPTTTVDEMTAKLDKVL